MGQGNRTTRILLLIGLLAAVAAAAFILRTPWEDDARPATALKRPVLGDELAPIRARWGAARHSSHDEELFVRDFFADRRGGFFVDVGAGPWRERSNTCFLEKELGWSGLAVDALPELADDYRLHRPRTKFFAAFVSDVADRQATLHVGENALFSSGESAFTNDYTDIAREVRVRTVTLDGLLAAEGVERIDFLSMDIELHEPQALAGFDIGRYRPALVCVEAHPQVRQKILDYFARHGYVAVARYLRADPQNLWFAPLSE